jgi:hypothetical protein
MSNEMKTVIKKYPHKEKPRTGWMQGSKWEQLYSYPTKQTSNQGQSEDRQGHLTLRKGAIHQAT